MYNIKAVKFTAFIWTGIEEVITALTRNPLVYEEHLSAECRINKGFLEKFNIAIFAVPSKSSLIFTSFFKLLKYIRTGIEVVITGLTRNQFVGNSGTWVRIPPRPPITRFLLRAKTLFFYEFPQKVPSLTVRKAYCT